MKRFTIESTPIDGLKLARINKILDERGFFERLFCLHELNQVVGKKKIVQINRSFTLNKGSLRGMHFQMKPKQELKIISCIRGCVFDVAVDLRKSSPTFLKWHSQILDAGSSTSFIIPEGFAHGFQTLTNDCEMLYFHTCEYAPELEQSINPFDPLLNITWPVEVTDISKKDLTRPMLNGDYKGI